MTFEARALGLGPQHHISAATEDPVEGSFGAVYAKEDSVITMAVEDVSVNGVAVTELANYPLTAGEWHLGKVSAITWVSGHVVAYNR